VKRAKPRESSGPLARRHCSNIGSDVVRSSDTPLQARARSFVRHVITPTVAAAAETYPELSVAEILAFCAPALARELAFELESACQQAVRETFPGRRAGVSGDD